MENSNQQRSNQYEVVHAFTGGLDTDTDYDYVKKDSYTMAYNVRMFTEQEGNGTLRAILGVKSLTNDGFINNPDNKELHYTYFDGEVDNDNKLVFKKSNFEIDYVIKSIGIRQYGIIIAKLLDGNKAIYRYNESIENGETKLNIHEIVRGDLFGDNISITSNWEDDDNIKIYIADGEKPIKYINVSPSHDELNYKTRMMTDESLRHHSHIKVLDLVKGNLQSGNVCYIVRPFVKNGHVGLASIRSSMVSLFPSDDENYTEGGKVSENSGKGVKIKYWVPSQYTNIQLYRILYKDGINNPSITLISEHEITNSEDDKTFGESMVCGYFTDYGFDGVDKDISELDFILNYNFVPKVIENKNNILFAANIKDYTNYDKDVEEYDTRSFRFPKNSSYTKILDVEENKYIVSYSDLNTLPNNHDCINPYAKNRDEDEYQYAENSEIIGGSGVNVHYKIIHLKFGEDRAQNWNQYIRPYQISDTTIDEGTIEKDMSTSNNAEFIRIINNTNGHSRDHKVHNDSNLKTDYMKYYYSLDNSTRSDINNTDYLIKSKISHKDHGSLNYSNPMLACDYRSYQRGELYRFGVVFHLKNGSKSSVKWIGDIRFPSLKKSQHRLFDQWGMINTSGNDNVSGEVYQLITYPMGIEFRFANLPKSVEYVEIVRCERDYKSSSIVAQGLVGRMFLEGERNENILRPLPVQTMSDYFGLYTYRSNHTSVDEPLAYVRNEISGVDFSNKLNSNIYSFISPEISYFREDFKKMYDSSNEIDILIGLASPTHVLADKELITEESYNSTNTNYSNVVNIQNPDMPKRLFGRPEAHAYFKGVYLFTNETWMSSYKNKVGVKYPRNYRWKDFTITDRNWYGTSSTLYGKVMDGFMAGSVMPSIGFINPHIKQRYSILRNSHGGSEIGGDTDYLPNLISVYGYNSNNVGKKLPGENIDNTYKMYGKEFSLWTSESYKNIVNIDENWTTSDKKYDEMPNSRLTLVNKLYHPFNKFITGNIDTFDYIDLKESPNYGSYNIEEADYVDLSNKKFTISNVSFIDSIDYDSWDELYSGGFTKPINGESYSVINWTPDGRTDIEASRRFVSVDKANEPMAYFYTNGPSSPKLVFKSNNLNLSIGMIGKVNNTKYSSYFDRSDLNLYNNTNNTKNIRNNINGFEFVDKYGNDSFYHTDTAGQKARALVLNSTFLANIYKPSNYYGGLGYNGRQDNEYITTGFYEANTEDGDCTIFTFNGDTFIGITEAITLHRGMSKKNPTNIHYLDKEDDWNNQTHGQKGQIVTYYPCESTINHHLVRGSQFKKFTANNKLPYSIQDKAGANYYGLQQSDNLYVYNSAYSKSDNVVTNVSTHKYVDENRINDTRIVYSQTKTNDEVIDKWLMFKPADYLDVDNNYGSITDIRKFKNQLLFWQETSFGLLSVKERSLINDVSGASVILGVGDVLSHYDYVSTVYGSSKNRYDNKLSSDGAFYWVDDRNKIIFKYNGQLEPISKTKLVHNVCQLIEKTDRFDLLNNKRFDEIEFSVGNITIVYNERVDRFTTLLTDRYYNHFWYTFNDEEKLICFEYNKPYLRDSGKYDKNGNPIKISITFSTNEQPITTKVFDTIELHMRMRNLGRMVEYFGKSNHLNTEIFNEDLTEISENLYRMKVPFSSDVEKTNSFIRPIQQNRMRGSYLLNRFKFIVNEPDTFALKLAKVKYRKSYN